MSRARATPPRASCSGVWRHFKALPDHLQVWPGHGAGSACGKGIGAVPQSTIGYERRTNWAFGIDEEEAFVARSCSASRSRPAISAS